MTTFQPGDPVVLKVETGRWPAGSEGTVMQSNVWGCEVRFGTPGDRQWHWINNGDLEPDPDRNLLDPGLPTPNPDWDNPQPVTALSLEETEAVRHLQAGVVHVQALVTGMYVTAPTVEAWAALGHTLTRLGTMCTNVSQDKTRDIPPSDQGDASMASEKDLKTLRAAAMSAALEGDGDRAEQIIAVGNMVEAGDNTQEDPPK